MEITKEFIENELLCKDKKRLNNWKTKKYNIDPEKIYLIYNDLDNIPLCKCGKNLNFISFGKGYSKYCSRSCAAKYQINRGKPNIEKYKQTCLEKYGVENPFQSEVIKDKIKETNLKKYGVENPMQSDKVKEKFQKTSLERYGETIPSKSKIVKEKISKSSKNHLSEVIEKKKNSCMKNYGVKCGFNTMSKEEIEQRGKSTAIGLKKYYQNDLKKYRFLYVIKDNISNMLKIGITTNISKRLNVIKNKCFDIELIYCKYFVNANLYEKTIQNHFINYCIVREKKYTREDRMV